MVAHPCPDEPQQTVYAGCSGGGARSSSSSSNSGGGGGGENVSMVEATESYTHLMSRRHQIAIRDVRFHPHRPHCAATVGGDSVVLLNCSPPPGRANFCVEKAVRLGQDNDLRSLTWLVEAAPIAFLAVGSMLGCASRSESKRNSLA